MAKKKLYILVLFVLIPLRSYAFDRITGPIEKDVFTEPSNLRTALNGSDSTEKKKLTAWVGCVSGFTGEFLSCKYKYELIGLAGDASDPAVNGGHSHNSNRALGTLSDINESGVKKVVGYTVMDAVKVVHELPEVSEKIQSQLDLEVPPGWHCSAQCFSDTSWQFLTTIDIGVFGLTELQDSDNDTYVKVRSPDANHTNDDAYYAAPNAQWYLARVADKYMADSGRKLSVNDMSLPKGGLFDIHGDWAEPHLLHRTGTSADINKSATGLDCVRDKELKISAIQTIPSLPENVTWVPTDKAVRSGPFLCEVGSNNNIHLDFDSHINLD